jgi:hypothetical protein
VALPARDASGRPYQPQEHAASLLRMLVQRNFVSADVLDHVHPNMNGHGATISDATINGAYVQRSPSPAAR